MLTALGLTFDALYDFACEWRQQDDVLPYPSHDRRNVLIETMWIFDLDHDILRFEKKFQSSRISLSDCRQRLVDVSDFKPYTLLKDQECTMSSYFQPPFQQHTCRTMQQQKSFISRLLADFAYQWRHVLQSAYYNEITFRRLACAIIRLITLNFKVVENDSPRRGKGGSRVWIDDLPSWEPFQQQIVTAGRVRVVICRRMPHAIQLIRDDFGDRRLRGDQTDESRYLIISVKEVVLYQISAESPEVHSRPQLLFDNTNAPTSEAIELLSNLCTRKIRTRIDNLSAELQEMILDYVCTGPIERARISCILQIGSIFSWKRKDSSEIQRQEGYTHRYPETPVESEVWFDGCHAGLAYK